MFKTCKSDEDTAKSFEEGWMDGLVKLRGLLETR